jgi:group II intron reverse transcriptase/maturase
MRPLAIGCLEDKIVQTVVARILEAIYEPTFHRHSYGFRPGKSAHQAIGRAHEILRNRQRRCVVVEMDIEKFFDTVDHEWLIRTLAERIDDPHFLRLIRRLLRNATLHVDGKLAEKHAGTPQGSPASPILANIYLHVLLDTWFVKHWATKGEFVRYVDDAIFVFTDEEDARSFQQALGARLAEAGLKLNLDKTRIVPFSASAPKGTITLLGFELYWGQHIGKGKRLNIPKRLARAMQNFREWVKAIRNRKTLATIWDMAAHKLVGHNNYYGVTSNEAKLDSLVKTPKWAKNGSPSARNHWGENLENGFLRVNQAFPLLLVLRGLAVSMAQPALTETLLHLEAIPGPFALFAAAAPAAWSRTDRHLFGA